MISAFSSSLAASSSSSSSRIANALHRHALPARNWGTRQPRHRTLPSVKKSSTVSTAGPNHARFDVAEVARKSGVRLTRTEIDSLTKRLDTNRNGVVSIDEFRRAGREALERQWAREICLSAVEQPTTAMDRLGARMLFVLDYGGKGLFAVVGTQIAGDAGMNIVGATLVGCISCMGGGTLNNLLYGTSALLDKPGVNWVRNPSCFFFAVFLSITTFFAWPVYCRNQAKEELANFLGKENLEEDGSAGREAFVRACERNADFKKSVASALDQDISVDPSYLFDLVDTDGSGLVEIDEMQSLVGHRFNASSTMYVLDSLALSALAVFGVHSAITRGLNPFVAATSGVTICFGGILRDVLCGRDLAVGGQSYAMATGAGSAVYVLLREISTRVGNIPIAVRIVLAMSATLSLRTYEYYLSEPLLRPMHYHPEHEMLQKRKEQRKTTRRNTHRWNTPVREQTDGPASLPGVLSTSSSPQQQ